MAEKALPSGNYLLLVGMALIVFGVIAVATPLVAGTAVVIVIGVVLLVAGTVQIIHGFSESSWSGKLLGLVMGIIAALAGLAVLAYPLLGLTVLTLVLAVFFLVEGIWKIIASFSFRPAAGWWAMLLSGAVALLLGYLIATGWPSSALGAVGVLVGVDLLSTGVSLVLLAITIKRLRRAVGAAAA